MPSTAVLCSIKNEAAYIVDWVAYYQALGASQIVIAQNDSSDGSDTLCQALEAAGHITYIDNSDPENAPQAHRGFPAQKRAYAWAKSLNSVQVCDYIFPIDIDEFLELKQDENLQTLLTRLKQPDAVSFKWRIMGSSGQTAFDSAPVFDRFQNGANAGNLGKQRAFHQIKTLFKTRLTDRFNVHRPVPNLDEKWVWLDPEGGSIFDEASSSNIMKKNSFSTAQLRHYHTKSLEEFKLKMIRGYASHGTKRLPNIGLPAFSFFDANEEALAPSAPVFDAARKCAAVLRTNHQIAQAENQALDTFRKLISLATELIDKNGFFKMAPAFDADLTALFQKEVYDRL